MDSTLADPLAAPVVTGAPPVEAVTSIREFLTFKLGDEEYDEEPTRLANMPAFIKGVVNLCGVIVLNIGQQVIGMVVDGVSDVTSMTAEQRRPVPEFSSAISNDHVLAIGSVGTRMLIPIDIEKLMSSAEMGLVTQALH